jgi:hypothetical protein
VKQGIHATFSSEGTALYTLAHDDDDGDDIIVIMSSRSSVLLGQSR